MVRLLTLAALSSAMAMAAPPTPSIGVFMDFDAEPTSVALKAMKNEVATIMKPAGLKVDWRWLKENRGTESFDGLMVVRFKGKCQLHPWDVEPVSEGSVTLGATRVSEGRVTPYSEVSCDEVVRTMQPGGEFAQEAALGRAMARVLAHELYHILADTTGHAMSGLAKASQTFNNLVGRPLGFREPDRAAMRRGLLR